MFLGEMAQMGAGIYRMSGEHLTVSESEEAFKQQQQPSMVGVRQRDK
jgi:hypothetical protein